jgi:hypothetical protein
MALALSASTVKSWFQYRCPRKSRYETLSSKERDAIPILRDLVTPPWAQLGNQFERRVVSRLEAETRILRPAVGEDYLSQRPFRFQATLDPLNAVDLDLLHAFELLENRAGMLDALVSLAQPFSQRRDRARCVAQMTLIRHRKTDWGRYSLLFSVPPESRESELSSSNFDLILTDDDPDLRLNPQLWPLFEVRIAPERPDFAASGTLLVDVAADVFEGDDFQRLLRETGENGWFLDRTFKDFTTDRAAGFMAFLGVAPA